jgi:glycosyltransferase involved in cell wall biosynthesis
MQALQKNDVDAWMLVQEQNFPDKQVSTIADSYIEKKKALLRFATDRFYFMLHEKNKQVRFAFSPANTGTDISKHPLIQNADIVHLHWINFGFLSLQSIEKLIQTGKPIVWTLHDMWAFTGGCHYSGECKKYQTYCHSCPFLKSPQPKDLSYRVFEKKLALFAKASISFVACSNWLADCARQSRLIQNFYIQAISNPIDTTIYKPAEKSEAKKALQLSTDKKLILFGAFKITDTRKGFTYLLEALILLQNKYPYMLNEVGLLVFGKTTEDDLWKNITFPVYNLGKVSQTEQLVNIYNAADVFVLPSLEDNLPNTIMESMACGTPVVAFNTGGIPEMINHLENGYLATYRSAADLAEGIYQVLFKQPYSLLSKASRQKVIENYSEEKVAEAYKQIYSKLVRI